VPEASAADLVISETTFTWRNINAGFSTSKALITPDVRSKMQSDNQNLMDMIKSQVSDLIL